MENNLKKYWFKRKMYGWGWTPSSWQGWLITILYIFVIMFLGVNMNENSSDYSIRINFVVPFVIVTAIFVLIAYKMGESPRWQWGKDEKK